jgi:SAM-dependent methyltransferase
MTTLLSKHLGCLRCVRCQGELQLLEPALRCTQCNATFPIQDGVPFLVDPREQPMKGVSANMEALFHFPSLYWLKINLLLRLNKTNDLDLRDFLRQKSVLDIGCGPFIYGYDASLPASIIGVDLSPQFVLAMSKHDPNNLYIVGNANSTPFADKSFDVSFLRYVIHHIPGDTGLLLAEAARVTRGYLIIFDHVRSDVPWQQTIQTAYWRTFDSGHHYNAMSEWNELLKPYRVAAFHRTGRMFGNICQIVLDLRGSG